MEFLTFAVWTSACSKKLSVAEQCGPSSHTTGLIVTALPSVGSYGARATSVGNGFKHFGRKYLAYLDQSNRRIWTLGDVSSNEMFCIWTAFRRFRCLLRIGKECHENQDKDFYTRNKSVPWTLPRITSLLVGLGWDLCPLIITTCKR